MTTEMADALFALRLFSSSSFPLLSSLLSLLSPPPFQFSGGYIIVVGARRVTWARLTDGRRAATTTTAREK